MFHDYPYTSYTNLACVRLADMATAACGSFCARRSEVEHKRCGEWCEESTTCRTTGGPGYVVDGGGWTLVRRVQSGAAWHPATDQMLGSDVYGEPVQDSEALATFSVKYNDLDFDQILIASGDAQHWLITTKEAIGGKFTGDYYSNSQRGILKSSGNPEAHEAAWYNRLGHVEDPWISDVDHAAAVANGQLLYGENSFNWGSHVKMLQNHNGANVFIRLSSGSSESDPRLKYPDLSGQECGGAVKEIVDEYERLTVIADLISAAADMGLSAGCPKDFPFMNPNDQRYCYTADCKDFEKNHYQCLMPEGNPCDSWCALRSAHPTFQVHPSCGNFCDIAKG